MPPCSGRARSGIFAHRLRRTGSRLRGKTAWLEASAGFSGDVDDLFQVSVGVDVGGFDGVAEDVGGGFWAVLGFNEGGFGVADGRARRLGWFLAIRPIRSGSCGRFLGEAHAGVPLHQDHRGDGLTDLVDGGLDGFPDDGLDGFGFGGGRATGVQRLQGFETRGTPSLNQGDTQP